MQAILNLQVIAKLHSKDMGAHSASVFRLLTPSILALRSQTSNLAMQLIQVIKSNQIKRLSIICLHGCSLNSCTISSMWTQGKWLSSFCLHVCIKISGKKHTFYWWIALAILLKFKWLLLTREVQFSGYIRLLSVWASSESNQQLCMRNVKCCIALLTNSPSCELVQTEWWCTLYDARWTEEVREVLYFLPLLLNLMPVVWHFT